MSYQSICNYILGKIIYAAAILYCTWAVIVCIAAVHLVSETFTGVLGLFFALAIVLIQGSIMVMACMFAVLLREMVINRRKDNV